MANSPTQDQRAGRLATPLGKDKLLLTRFDGAEAIGELFEYQVEALSLDPDIDFDQVLGLNSSVHLDTVDDAGRDFGGIVSQARKLGARGEFFAYALTMRPWLWLLSLTSDCRIFANLAPIAIIKQVFEDRGFSDVIDLTSGDYPTLEYTVQYRETDLNFVLRLMELYGIYYYFQFMPGDGISPSAHVLVLADSTVHVPLPNLAKLTYRPSGVEVRADEQQVSEWTATSAMVTGVFAVNDYDYQKPQASLLASTQHAYHFSHGAMEIYNYPGGHNTPQRGNELTGASADAEATRNKFCQASGAAPSLTPGFAILRSSTGGDSEDGQYLILRCSHAYGPQTYESAEADSGATYSGAYAFSKSGIPYRMPAFTRKPVVVGTQSALVVGKDGEEIDVDDQGRILVQFYWDRKKKPSRRVRAAQAWAGSVRGFWFVPRIGDEVLVQFEEGDPDRPVVTGSVYNATNTPSVNLPSDKSHSGILTRSTKNAGVTHYNMLMFDDTFGQERLKMRAERDLMFKALRNEQRDIGGSQTENVGGSVTQTVGGDETITVGGGKGGGRYMLEAAHSIDLSVADGASEILMDATTITLTVAGSSITIDASGIEIKAPMVKINGDALTDIKGAIVKINS